MKQMTEKEAIYATIEKLSERVHALEEYCKRMQSDREAAEARVDAWLDKPVTPAKNGQHKAVDTEPKVRRLSPGSDDLKLQVFELYEVLRSAKGDTVSTYMLADSVKAALRIKYSQSTIYNWLVKLGAPRDGKAFGRHSQDQDSN